MSKLSSKIIISLMLAMVLWSGMGIGLNSQDKKTSSSFLINVAYGQSPNSAYHKLTPEQKAGVESACAGKSGRDRNACIDNESGRLTADEDDGSWTTRFLKAAGEAITGFLGKTVMMLQGILLQIILIPLLSILLRVAAAMLGIATEFTLSTQIFTNTEAGVFLIWSYIRNICNITFIFILLWGAIQTIVGLASGKTKKIIADVVVAALLINFSLFITRVIIDAGNILALNLYNKILGGNGSIDTSIMDALGMTSLWGAMGTAADGAGSIYSIAFGVISYLQVITILVAFITFVYAMLLMATRIVMLIFLAATSPIGFMGNVLPRLAEYSKLWRETLYGQVMIAPIFLLFLYLIVKIGGAFQNLGFNIDEGASVSATTTSALSISQDIGADRTTDYGAYFNYVMIILLLVVAVKITKKMAGPVGAAVEGFAKGAAGLALGAATGGAALIGRQTMGRFAANRLEERGDDLRARAASGNRGARIELAALERTSRATFDARNTRTMGAVVGQANRLTGLNINGGTPGGLTSRVGLGTTVAESRTNQQTRENQEYNRLNASVTNRQRLAANGARVKRDGLVDDEIEGTIDPTTGQRVSTTVTTAEGLEYQRLKTERRNILSVADTHRELANEQAGLTVAQTELARARATGDQAQINKAQKELNDAERVKNNKIKEIQEDIKKKRAGEIAQLDEDMRAIRTSRERHHEQNSLTAPEQAQMAVVNQARNYAESVRRGRFGSSGLSGEVRRNQIADRMENQRA